MKKRKSLVFVNVVCSEIEFYLENIGNGDYTGCDLKIKKANIQHQ